MILTCATVAFAVSDTTEFLPSYGYKKGDVNIDGDIDVKDVVLVLRHIVGMITFTDTQYSLADIDSNGNVNVLDALYIQELILNMPETPTEKPTIPATFPDKYEEDDKPIELPFVPVD